MLSFRNTSIQRKQTLILMLTSGIVLLVACAAFVTYDTIALRRKLIESVAVLADVVATNCTAAIDYNDAKTARETLAALQVNQNIVFACIYTREGDVFAVFQRDPETPFVRPALQQHGQKFTGWHLHLFRPILQGDERSGTIFVASDLKDINARLVRYFGIVGVVFIVSLLLAFMLSSRLQRVVSDPILQLARVARSVAVEKNYAVRATKRSNDELGELVDGFNEMLAQIQARDTALRTAREDREKRAEERARELEVIHQQLVDASRRSGMAEIATNVLHNVGNVLNSVNISAGLIVENVSRSQTSNLERVVSLMRDHTHDLGDFITRDERGKNLPAYLGALSEQLMSEQRTIVGELDSLRRNVEHIKQIVAMQQNYATFGGVTESIDIVALVEDGLRMNEGVLARHSVEVVRDFQTLPPISVEKHKILQIVVNLLRNAKHACDYSSRDDKQITLRVRGDGEHIWISITDNGVGIPPENLTRIFNHGFTTKKDGHGFGLHSGALAAREMGGSLTVHSAGRDRGAAFTLKLPVKSTASPS